MVIGEENGNVEQNSKYGQALLLSWEKVWV